MATIRCIDIILELAGGVVLVLGLGTLIGHLLKLKDYPNESPNDRV